MLIAADTNVLLDRATEDGDVIDALGTIRERLKAARFIVTPTAIQELAALYEKGNHEQKSSAERALSCLLSWGFEPLNLIAAGHGIVEQIGMALS